jgi:hypothetical protein
LRLDLQAEQLDDRGDVDNDEDRPTDLADTVYEEMLQDGENNAELEDAALVPLPASGQPFGASNGTRASLVSEACATIGGTFTVGVAIFGLFSQLFRLRSHVAELAEGRQKGELIARLDHVLSDWLDVDDVRLCYIFADFGLRWCERLASPTNALDIFFEVDPRPENRIARVLVNLQEGFDVDLLHALSCICTDAEVLFVQINWDEGRLYGNIPRFLRVCVGDEPDGQPLLLPLPLFGVVKHLVAGLAEANAYWCDPATSGTAWVHHLGGIEYPCEEHAVFAAVHDAPRRGIVPLLCHSYAPTIPTSSGLANPLASPEGARAVIPRIVSDDRERVWDLRPMPLSKCISTASSSRLACGTTGGCASPSHASGS